MRTDMTILKRSILLVIGVCGLLAVEASEAVFPNAFTMFNIIPAEPGKEEVAAHDAAEYVERTGNPHCLLMLVLSPKGKPAMKNVEAAVASYRRWAKLLEGSQVKPGILLQAIIGHGTADLAFKDIESWQRAIDVKGRPTRFCPLDPGYRAYIREVGRQLASCHPSVILGDDDIRPFAPEAECTCPLHTAEYNRRTGRNLTCDGLRELLDKADWRSPEHQAFAELQRDTIVGVCRLLREGIDSVDPSIPSGVCEPGWSWGMRYVPDFARAMAGANHTPFLRLANGRYQEELIPKDEVGQVTLRTMAERERLKGENVLMLDEADTCPHTLWSKSSVAFHAKLVAAAFLGLNGAKMWYVNGHKGKYPVSRHYTEILEKHRGLYSAVSAAVRGTEQTGVLVPCHGEFPSESIAHRKGIRTFDEDGWTQGVFTWYGVPFAATYDLMRKDAVYALSGETAVGRFTDEELASLLSCRVLVDGAAAVALVKRGFGDLLGVSLRESVPPFVCDYNEANGDSMAYPPSSKPPLFAPAEGVEALSNFIWRESPYAKSFERICPSTVLCRNRRGGIVITTALVARLGWVYSYSDSRQAWLYGLLDRLNGRPTDNVCANTQNVMALSRRAADGADLVFLQNLSTDPEHGVKIRRGEKPASVEEMDAHGRWTAKAFGYAGGIVDLDGDWASQQVRIFRFR